MLKFFNTQAGKWVVIMAAALIAGYFIWQKFFSGLSKGAGEAANLFDFTDKNNNSYTAASKVGKAVTGNPSWSLSDLFPKSSAEKQVEQMLKSEPSSLTERR